MFRQALRLGPAAVLLGAMTGTIWASPAWADYTGGAICDRETESCEISAGVDQDFGGDPGGDFVPSGAGGSSGADAHDPFAGWDCEYQLLETDAESDAHAGERPSPDHQLLMKTCTDPATGTSIQERTWVAPGDDGIPVDPAVLAAEAVDNLVLPAPRVASSPHDFQLVRLPTWLWLAGDSWQRQTASASVPGLTVTAVAVPTQATWQMGDGTTVVCEDSGTAWNASYGPEAASPTCGHTYTRSSAHVPGGEYAVLVTVEWSVTWSGGGQSGTEPGMTTRATASWPVAESQSIVR